MPLYRVVTSGVELGREQRDILATRFTAAHHEVVAAQLQMRSGRYDEYSATPS